MEKHSGMIGGWDLVTSLPVKCTIVACDCKGTFAPSLSRLLIWEGKRMAYKSYAHAHKFNGTGLDVASAFSDAPPQGRGSASLPESRFLK